MVLKETLKETLAYYTIDGGVSFCTMLDATKAFDRVEYCKLFRELFKRWFAGKISEITYYVYDYVY